MKLTVSVIEIIKKRHSVRTYENKPLTLKEQNKILDVMNNLKNPFNIKVSKYIVDKKLNGSGEKLGTYGIVKGANTFIGISVPNIKFAPLAAGYEFENLILYATSIGLGTVWLAATFKRDIFSKVMKVPEDELLLAISPVGYPARKRSLTEKMMRSTMKSSKRKKWEDLFFQENFENPLTKRTAGDYKEPLEMIRLAPSSKNEQPWRILKTNEAFHFYLVYKSNLSEAEKLIKQVDLGIALAHFHQTVLELGLTGKFDSVFQDNDQLPLNMHYMISWNISK